MRTHRLQHFFLLRSEAEVDSVPLLEVVDVHEEDLLFVIKHVALQTSRTRPIELLMCLCLEVRVS